VATGHRRTPVASELATGVRVAAKKTSDTQVNAATSAHLILNTQRYTTAKSFRNYISFILYDTFCTKNIEQFRGKYLIYSVITILFSLINIIHVEYIIILIDIYTYTMDVC